MNLMMRINRMERTKKMILKIITGEIVRLTCKKTMTEAQIPRPLEESNIAYLDDSS